ncbi:MAG: hypothetical protein ACREX0_04025 [Noviherbaspirillum sp.]
MKVEPASKAKRRVVSQVTAEPGEIFNLAHQPTAIWSGDLQAIDEAASLPSEDAIPPGPIAPLTKFLGPELTVSNPVWGEHSVPRMRALQKKLVEFSLTLEESDRAECMAAISQVESAVQLRLRLEQMRMIELEESLISSADPAGKEEGA